MKHSELFF